MLTFLEALEDYDAEAELFHHTDSVHNTVSRCFWLNEKEMEELYIDAILSREENKKLYKDVITLSPCQLITLIESIRLVVEERDLLKKKLRAAKVSS